MNTGMKSSTIKSTIRNTIGKWLKTIADPDLKKLLEKDSFVTGGAIASMLQGEMPNDYDIYFKNFYTAELVARYYVAQFNQNASIKAVNSGQTMMHYPEVRIETRVNCKEISEPRVIIYMKSAGVASESQKEYRYFEGLPEANTEEFFSALNPESQVEQEFQKAAEDLSGYAEDFSQEIKRLPGRPVDKALYRPVFLSENAITLSDKVQLIVRFSGEPAKLHENYDYVHCTCWYDYETDHLELPQAALQSILSKSLIYVGSLYPLASVFRTRKFIERGWRITAGQMLKILFQISELNLKDIATLREQLTGVDQAYMHQLLRAIENKDGKIDSAYLTKLIDEIFE